MILNKKNKLRMKLYLKYLMSRSTDFYFDFKESKQKVFVTLAADYGNLGDVAITYAQTKFLQSKFPEADIIDFPISKTFEYIKSLIKIVKSTDIITIVGGGILVICMIVLNIVDNS